jgi:hypothetical protein
MIKKTLIGHQYFIKVTNILHKLLNELATLRLTLIQLAQLVIIVT